MTRTRRMLRLDDLDRIVDVPAAEEPVAREAKNGRRFEVYTRPVPPVQDDLDDFWNNVPV